MSRRRPPDQGAAASVKLIEGAGLDDAAFREAYKWDSSYILFEVFGDDNEVLGLAVGKVDNVWPFDVNGGFVEISYLGTDSEYYRWFIENRGKKGGLPEDVGAFMCNDGQKSVVKKLVRSCENGVTVGWPVIVRTWRGILIMGMCTRWMTTTMMTHHLGSRENVLDRMMEVPEEVPDRDGAGVGPLDAKLSDLRGKLRSKVGRKGGGPGMLLAEKAQSAMSAKKKKRRSNQEDVVKKLRRALSSGRTKARGSTDPGDDWSDSESEDDDDLYEGRGHQSDISARRKKLKKIAEDHPGKLLEQGLSLMKEQVGATYGGGAEEEERLTPVVMRYYLSVVLPNYPVKVQGEARVREMRTLASALDLLCRGKIDSAADMLMQRFKSLCMSLRDNSDRFGKFLELLPDDVVGTATTLDEVEFARTLAVKQAKADEILARASGKPDSATEEAHQRKVSFTDQVVQAPKVQGQGAISQARKNVPRKAVTAASSSPLYRLGDLQEQRIEAHGQATKSKAGVGQRDASVVIAPAASHAETAAQAKCLQSKQVDYSGDEVLKALPLRLGELMPGLPEDGVAGSLDASAIADDTVQRWLLDPTVTLLEPASWPDPLPAASMKVDREHWFEIVGLLFKKRILVPIDFEEIFKVRGKPVLNGVFAVEKKGTPLPGELRVTRLIMNLVPANSLQKLMAGDLGEALLWSGDDQRGAFYAWIVGRPDVDMIYVASGVIPMGWLNAVSGAVIVPCPRERWKVVVDGLLGILSAPVAKMLEAGMFMPSGSHELPKHNGPRIFCVSLFDGVAALMVALARLECCVIGYAASEMDKHSKRLIRTRWPGVMELGPVQHITDRVVQHLVACIGYRIDFVLVGAALSNGRSGSLSDVVRIINLLKDAFAVPVHFMVEHDINMSGEQLVEFSRLLEVKPYLVDAKHFTWIRKPSLFWVSWFITARDGEKLVDHESYSLLLRDLGLVLQ
ncbi:unnamed protein product [Symbiodinium necroappetens]|uniref:Uncharacterized protein n=1 Tax=Symbiodinium necroappetens TaxID=1628268 RepID=A0A812VIV9_9DINO|nr:unnamed protein product [Symbiodinium necroappetens]